jgi:HD superfamily phosphodiesterase
MRPQDKPIWEAALPYLDVRSNDEHTLYSYVLLQELLAFEPVGDPNIVLPTILLHDIGWKMVPADKILQSFGPNKKYPELERLHEVQGAQIAKRILTKLKYPAEQIEQITAIIDGHDTTKIARSTNDALVKEADKLWRYTPHGIKTIQSWFQISVEDVFEILENFVMPTFLTENGRIAAKLMLEKARSAEKVSHLN